MKTCFKCRAGKPISEFYANPKMADGHLGKCKDCAKTDSMARHLRKLQDPEWVESNLLRQRIRASTLRAAGIGASFDPQRKSVSDRLQRLKSPEKYKARCMVRNAIRRGELSPSPCFCGNTGEAHHEDYSKPLDVVWLCLKHHAQRHVEIRAMQRAAQRNQLQSINTTTDL